MHVNRAPVAGFEGIDPGGELTIDHPTSAVSMEMVSAHYSANSGRLNELTPFSSFLCTSARVSNRLRLRRQTTDVGIRVYRDHQQMACLGINTKAANSIRFSVSATRRLP
jgi:hypothetical protein